MKRASALRACAIVGTAFSVLACSGSNPTVPPGVTPGDASSNERGIAQIPDTAPPAIEAAADDTSSPIDREEAPSIADVANVIDGAIDGGTGAIDGATDATDALPPSKVIVTILDPSAVSSVDGGSDDGGGNTPIIAKTDRLAPSVRVEVQSQGGDPTLDIITSIKATLVSESTKKSSLTISLNQTQYEVIPESNSKVYFYADTPFDLSGLAGDFYTLQVTAITAGGMSATDLVRIYIDGGPLITFLQPADGVYVKGSVAVTVMIVDNRSGITGVAFSVGKNQIDPAAVKTYGAQYSTVIDFGSYNPPLDGNQMVTVSATNGNGNTSLATRNFTIDNVGPLIANPNPAAGVLIGKIITIEATVTDPAGVMDSSVISVVANGDIQFEVNLVKDPKAQGHYFQIFDTTKLSTYAIFPSISFRAQDVLGNESSVGYLVSLDNTPPVMDLDPPAHFQLIRKDGTCSWPFDPVGPDAIDDGSVVTQLFDIRARIEDLGNTPLTGTADFVPISGVDPATVKVLILDDTSLPLVVDTSDPPDGICDDINPELVPSVSPQSSKEAQLINLGSMPANSGAGDFTPQPGSKCSGKDSNPPPALCETTYSEIKNQDMTYSLGYSGDNLPSIWAIQPITGNALQCAGRQFDASNNLHDGWACVAVEASDKLGNKQVSRPIRICVAAQPDSTACTAAASGGADIASISLPSSSTGSVAVTTKSAVVAGGATAIKTGDTLIFSNAAPAPFSVVNGSHAVSPKDATGTLFDLTDLSVTPFTLYVDNLDSNPPVLKGTVGLIAQDGAVIQVVTDTPNTVLDPGFAGAIVLMNGGSAPTASDLRWSVHDIQSTGFTLVGSTVKLTGAVIPALNLPNCTGTVVKQTSGSTVDATKPCQPWASFPQYEALIIN